MSMKLTLYKQTEIDVEMPLFIEHLLKLYRLKRPLENIDSLCGIIWDTIERMTMYSLYEYDHSLYAIQTVMKNAYICAIELDYPQTDIDDLKEIVDLIDK